MFICLPVSLIRNGLVYIRFSKHQHFKLCFGSESWARLFLTTSDISVLGMCLWILFMTHEPKLSLSYSPPRISPSGPLRITDSFPQTSLNSTKWNKQLLSVCISGSSQDVCVWWADGIRLYRKEIIEEIGKEKKRLADVVWLSVPGLAEGTIEINSQHVQAASCCLWCQSVNWPDLLNVLWPYDGTGSF